MTHSHFDTDQLAQPLLQARFAAQSLSIQSLSIQPLSVQSLSTQSLAPDALWLGVDGGGTKCQAVLVDATGRCIGRGRGGSANAFVDSARTQASIIDAARAALADAGLPADALGRLVVSAGLAGVNVPRAAAQMTAWQHPFARFNFMSDLYAACYGAHGGADGRVIVLGTGSCGARVFQGECLIVGGHGLALGDDASGAWLGREALRLHLLARDGLIPPTLISPLLHQYAPRLFDRQVDDWVDFMQTRTTADFAKLCIVLIEAANAGDAAASVSLNQALDYVERLANRLKPAIESTSSTSSALPLALVGGLVDLIAPQLRARLSFSAPQFAPEIGALLAPVHIQAAASAQA